MSVRGRVGKSGGRGGLLGTRVGVLRRKKGQAPQERESRPMLGRYWGSRTHKT